MIAVYYQREEQLASFSRAPLSDLDICAAERWGRFANLRARADCSVILMKALGTDPIFERLVRDSSSEFCPTVLVTSRDVENARHLCRVLVTEVLWFDEMNHSLFPAIQRVRCSTYSRRTAEEVRRSDLLPPKLRSALIRACEAEAPIRSVSALAAAVGCDRSTLWRQWHRVQTVDASIRLEDCLDWLVILRVIGLRAIGRKGAAVARELKIPERTLRRMFRRQLGCTLLDVDAERGLEIAMRVHEGARSLFGTGACNDLS
jgi:AraC-like DNA-binding protein